MIFFNHHHHRWLKAERVGFEPTVTVKPQRFSRPSPSSTRSSLRDEINPTSRTPNYITIRGNAIGKQEYSGNYFLKNRGVIPDRIQFLSSSKCIKERDLRGSFSIFPNKRNVVVEIPHHPQTDGFGMTHAFLQFSSKQNTIGL